MRWRRRSNEFNLASASRGAEIHRFEGRLFVTTRMGVTWGARVPEDASAEDLGRSVLDAMAHTQRDKGSALVVGLDELDRRQQLEAQGLERFCREVVGVGASEYRPEIRADVFETDGEIWIRPSTRGLDDDRKVVLPAGTDAEVLGETVLRVIEAEEPQWPAAFQAFVFTVAGGRLIVQPVREIHVTGPMVLLDGPGGLGAAIRVTLEESGKHDPSALEYKAALRAVGVTEADLAGGAGVSIVRNTQGQIILSALRPDPPGWVDAGLPTVTVEDEETVADAVLDLLTQVATRHRQPGRETGAAFGHKTAWLAVRGASAEAVVAAIGLQETRPIGWEQGVEESYRSTEGGIFVSPETSGWVIAVGVGWFANPPDAASLSRALDAEVQYFATHRVSEAHSWEVARDGVSVRRVFYAGDQGEAESVGEPTEAERQLGLAEVSFESDVDEDNVLEVAAAWSLDPRELDTTPTSAATGTFGERRS
jgi:hypothetical protein